MWEHLQLSLYAYCKYLLILFLCFNCAWRCTDYEKMAKHINITKWPFFYFILQFDVEDFKIYLKGSCLNFKGSRNAIQQICYHLTFHYDHISENIDSKS